MTRREKNRMRSSYLLFHSPKSCNGWAWVRSKAGAWNSSRISSLGGGCPNTWAIFCHFPHTLAGSWIRFRSARSHTGTPNQMLVLLCHNPDPFPSTFRFFYTHFCDYNLHDAWVYNGAQKALLNLGDRMLLKGCCNMGESEKKKKGAECLGIGTEHLYFIAS